MKEIFSGNIEPRASVSYLKLYANCLEPVSIFLERIASMEAKEN